MTNGLSDCIMRVYAEPPDNHLNDLRIFDELRADIVNLEPHQSALERLIKYVVGIPLAFIPLLVPQLTFCAFADTMLNSYLSAQGSPLM